MYDCAVNLNKVSEAALEWPAASNGKRKVTPCPHVILKTFLDFAAKLCVCVCVFACVLEKVRAHIGVCVRGGATTLPEVQPTSARPPAQLFC